MKRICFYFQVHQPFRLKNYRYFDIGNHHEYFDEKKNRMIMEKVAEKSYIPANKILLNLIQKFGNRFKVSFSISGTALDQFELYAPETLKSFQELAATGQVEFLSETYAHSLSSIRNPEEFKKQVKDHSNKIEILFNQKPKVFRNTELIYSDHIGKLVSSMGYKTILAEGADHVLTWKSPNYLYQSEKNPELKILLKNYRLSDDIAFRFSQFGPLGVEKFTEWIDAIPKEEEIINLFMDYETFGEHQWKETGIFDFLKAFPAHILEKTEYTFVTPGEAANELKAIASISMPKPVSWADEERNLSAWLGNGIQDDAFESIYRLEKKINRCSDDELIKDWRYLQTSDHFYYMCTKHFADGDVHKYFNPYDSPYEAFINFMNVLSDFEERLENKLMQKKNNPIFLRRKIKSILEKNEIKLQALQ